MEHDGVEANTIEEAQAMGKFLDLVENSSANFDDSKLGRIGRIRGRRKDAEVAFDFTLSSNGIEKASDSVLRTVS